MLLMERHRFHMLSYIMFNITAVFEQYISRSFATTYFIFLSEFETRFSYVCFVRIALCCRVAVQGVCAVRA